MDYPLLQVWQRLNISNDRSDGQPGASDAADLGSHTKQRLNDMKEKHPLIGNVCGLGLHMGIDLVKDRHTKERAVDEAERIMFKCLEKGLSFKLIEGNLITLRPALIISKEEMNWAMDILDESISEVEKENNL